MQSSIRPLASQISARLLTKERPIKANWCLFASSIIDSLTLSDAIITPSEFNTHNLNKFS